MPPFKIGQSKDLTPAEQISKEHEKMRRKEDKKVLKEKRKMDAEELEDRKKEEELWGKIREYEDSKPKPIKRAGVERDIWEARRLWFEKIISNNQKYGHTPKDADFELHRLQYFTEILHIINKPGPAGGMTQKFGEAHPQAKGKGKEKAADLYFDLVPLAIRDALWNDPLLNNLEDRFRKGSKLAFADIYLKKVYNAEAEISKAQWVQGIDTVKDGEAKQGLLERMHEYHTRLSLLWTLRFAHDVVQDIHTKEVDELSTCVNDPTRWKYLEASKGQSSYVEAALKVYFQQNRPFQA